jgi:hypothetical protein
VPNTQAQLTTSNQTMALVEIEVDSEDDSAVVPMNEIHNQCREMFGGMETMEFNEEVRCHLEYCDRLAYLTRAPRTAFATAESGADITVLGKEWLKRAGERAYQYLALVNNWTADRTLRWKCPHTKRFGVTPDKSALLSFHFYEPVYYLDIEEPTPYTKEKAGYWLGVAHNVGDALTYHILTDDTQQVIQRSVSLSTGRPTKCVTLHKQNQNVSLPNPLAISSEEILMERQHKRFRKKRGARGALTERSKVNGKIQANDGIPRIEEDALREDTEDENMIDEQDDHQENEDEIAEEIDAIIGPGEEEVYSIRRSPSRFVNAGMVGLQMGKFLYSEPIGNVLTPLQNVPGAHAIILEQDMTTSSFLSRPEVNKLRELYVADSFMQEWDPDANVEKVIKHRDTRYARRSPGKHTYQPGIPPITTKGVRVLAKFFSGERRWLPMEAVRGDNPIPLIDYSMKYDLRKQSDRWKIPCHMVFDCKFDGRRKGRLVAGGNHTVVTSE